MEPLPAAAAAREPARETAARERETAGEALLAAALVRLARDVLARVVLGARLVVRQNLVRRRDLLEFRRQPLALLVRRVGRDLVWVVLEREAACVEIKALLARAQSN